MTPAARAQALSWLGLAAGTAALALLFLSIRVAAALLLGPMLVAIAFACGGTRLGIGRIPFLAAQGVVGALVGRSITAAILTDVAANWLVMIGFVGGTIVAAAAVGWLLARFTSLGAETAAWGSSPGGASAMVAAAADFGADTRIVAFMQYLRVMLVVLSASAVSRLVLGATPHGAAVAIGDATLPPLGPLTGSLALKQHPALIASRLHIPAGPILLTMVAGAVVSATNLFPIVLPWWLIAGAYTAIGWFVGLRFTRDVVRYVFRALPALAGSTLLLIVLCAAVGEALRGTIGADALTAYLATSPGGLDSIAIIALGSGANVPLILAIQTLRVFLVILTGPAIAKFISRTAARAG